MLTRTFLRPLPIQYDSPFVLCLWQRQVHCRQERVNLCQFIAHIIMVKSDVSYIYCFPCHAVFRSTFVLCYSNIVLNIQTPNTSGHWSLDPWLIDYGGVSWLAFNMWTITSLASLIKVQIRLRTCVQIMRPGATRSKSFDNCRGWSWCGRDCFPNYSIACSCDDQLAHYCTMFPCYLGTDFQCRHPIWTEQWQRLSSLATN